jgi:hypothetical protein
MPLTIAARETEPPAPADFGAALNDAAREYAAACVQEDQHEEHKRAEIFCRYVAALHAQDASQVDDVLDLAHQLVISIEKAQTDYRMIAEVNQLKGLADAKEAATAEWQARSNELIEWRASFNAESFKRMQAVNAAEMRKNDCDDARQKRKAMMAARPELFPEHIINPG